MDHAIKALQEFLEPEVDELLCEWDSGKFSRLEDCYSYPAAKALLDAIHRLERYYYGNQKTLNLKELIV